MGESARSCLIQLHHKSAVVKESFGTLTPHLLKLKISVTCAISDLYGGLDGVQRSFEPLPAFDPEVMVWLLDWKSVFGHH